MQIYALKMFNFLRFGNHNNCVVFDMLDEYQNMSLDQLYEQIRQDPLTHIRKIKEKGITNLISIAGMIGNDFDNSNGVGKSTILESLCYAFYEQLVRRTANNDKTEKATRVIATCINNKIPEEIKESYVEVIFEENEKVYILKRGRSFSKDHEHHAAILKFSCVHEEETTSESGHRISDTDESIFKVINMDYDIFVNSVLFGQADQGKFLMSTDADRKEMLIRLLHLENVVSGCLEKVREKKNKKQKAVETLVAQVNLLIDNIKSKSSIDNIQKEIVEKEKQITEKDLLLKKCRDQIESLSSSDIIKELESIKTDGQKIQNDLNEKKKQKESRIQEWNNLLQESDKSLLKRENEINELVFKRKDLNDKMEMNKQKIESFNSEEKQKDLATVEKAKQYKPKFVEIISSQQSQNIQINSSVVLSNSEIKKRQDEIASLQKQLDCAGNKSEFTCDKCKSIVSRKHIEEEIQKNKIEKEKYETEANSLKENLNKISEQLKENQIKLEKINNWLIKEGNIRSDIQQHENNKDKQKELIFGLTECEKTLEKSIKEKANIEQQKEQYQNKISEIGKQYEQEILNITNKLDELKRKYKSADESSREIKSKIELLKNQSEEISSAKASCNSHIGFLKKEIETIEDETKKIKSLQDQIKKENQILSRLVILEGCFGLDGIQTRIIHKYIQFLNIYIKEYMDILSEETIVMEIVINDKSKIDIVITGGTANKYELLSGGEKTLCRLASSIGLAMLSFLRCARKPSLICLDEVFSPLDDSHVETAFKLLEKLQNQFNRILIISHKAEINGRIPHQILVEKDEGLYGRSRIKRAF